MAEIQKVIKTQYMDKPVRGYSEYFFYDDEARNSISPVVGDRCLMRNGDVYVCWEVGVWSMIGGDE
jgi:hypothetical protein